MSGQNALLSGGGTSIPAMVSVPQQANPFAQVGQYAQTANALMGLQQNQMQIRARQAIGQAYQQSINPDGTLNTNKLLSNVAGNPDAAYMAGDVAQQALARQQAQTQISGEQLKQASDRVGFISNQLSVLLNDPNAQPKDAIAAMGRVVSNRNFGVSAADGANLLSDMPMQRGPAFTQWLQQQALKTASFQEKINAMRGGIVQTNIGGGIQTQSVPGVFGASNGQVPQNIGAPLPLTATPAEQAQQVPAPPGPLGQPQNQSNAAYMLSHGLGYLVPGGSGAPTVPVQTAPLAGPGAAGGGFGSGRYPNLPPALRGPNAPPAATPGVAAPNPNNPPSYAPMPTALGPGQSSAATASGAASATQFAADANAAAGTPGRIFQLQQAATGLAADPTSTGPGSQGWNALRQARIALGVAGPDTIKTQADYDETNKNLVAYAMSRANAAGGNTDSQLASTLESNANIHISNLAAQNVVKANMGLERMQQAAVQQFQNSVKAFRG